MGADVRISKPNLPVAVVISVEQHLKLDKLSL